MQISDGKMLFFYFTYETTQVASSGYEVDHYHCENQSKPR